MSKQSNPTEKEAIKNAANQPHGFVYIDQILKAKTDGYMVQLTLGWETPKGDYAPVATAAFPAPFAKLFAEELMALAALAAEKRAKVSDS